MTHPLSLSRNLLLGLFLALGGCLSSPTASDLPKAPTILPATMPKAPALAPYRLQIGDVIEIKLLLNPELNDQVTVRPDGLISTAIAQDVPAYNRTPLEVQQDLEGRYESQLKEPRLSVIVRSFAPTRIYVTGEVNAPGEFITIGPNLTLMQAIARAGGVKTTAQEQEIVILRRGESDTPVALATNYQAAATGNDPGSDVRLAPYDVVYVPRSGIGNAYLNYQQYFQQFVPFSLGFSYQLNPVHVNNNNNP